MRLNLDDKQVISDYLRASHIQHNPSGYSKYRGKSIIFYQDGRYGIGTIVSVRPLITSPKDYVFSVRVKRKLFTRNWEDWGHGGDLTLLGVKDYWNVAPNNAAIYFEDFQLELFEEANICSNVSQL